MGFAATPLAGIAVPDENQPLSAYPVDLLAVAVGLESISVPIYADAATGDTKNTSPTAWQVRALTSPGRLEVRHPTYGWVPVGWSRRLVADAPSSNPSVTPVGSVAATTQTLTVGPFAFPHIIDVTYQLYGQCSSAGNDFNAYLNVNGNTADKSRAGAPSATATVCASIVNLGTGQSVAATQLTGGIEKVLGSDTVLARCDDTNLTKLTVVVRPYLTSAA